MIPDPAESPAALRRRWWPLRRWRRRWGGQRKTPGGEPPGGKNALAATYCPATSRSQYRRRWGASRPCAGWERVGPPRSSHQNAQSVPQPAGAPHATAGRIRPPHPAQPAAARAAAGVYYAPAMSVLRRPALRLFLLTFIALYAELLCIRWIPAHVRFVSYFTNFILLASFLGLGVGILSARRAGACAPACWPSPGCCWRWSGWWPPPGSSCASNRPACSTTARARAGHGAAGERPGPAGRLPARRPSCSSAWAAPSGVLLSEVQPAAEGLRPGRRGSLAGIAAFFLLSLTEQPP